MAQDAAEEAAKASRFLFCIISKGRAKNVGEMHELFKGTNLLPTWIVGEGETAAYMAEGAVAVAPLDLRVSPDWSRGPRNLKTEIPFGPYIITAGVIYYCFGEFLYSFILAV